MQPPDFRTKATSLTDNELFLLDVLFESGAFARMLRRRGFQEQWNSPSHTLSDVEVKETIKRWKREGVLSVERHPLGPYVKLTPKGGKIWEEERCPDWKRFCKDRYPSSRDGRPIVLVKCVSKEICHDFLRVSLEKPLQIKTKTVKDRGLINWRTFDKLYVGIAFFDDELFEENSLDFETRQVRLRSYLNNVEENRTWWRTVFELQKFIEH